MPAPPRAAAGGRRARCSAPRPTARWWTQACAPGHHASPTRALAREQGGGAEGWGAGRCDSWMIRLACITSWPAHSRRFLPSSVASCDAAYWSYTPWSPCSATCGGGNTQRTATCAASAGMSCDADPGATQATCNTGPCESYTWSVGDWQTCNSACGGTCGGGKVELLACMHIPACAPAGGEGTCQIGAHGPHTRMRTPPPR